jgi:hypothetical protein
MIDLAFMLTGIVFGITSGLAKYLKRPKTYLLILLGAIGLIGAIVQFTGSGQQFTSGIIADFDILNFLGFISLSILAEKSMVTSLNEWRPAKT